MSTVATSVRALLGAGHLLPSVAVTGFGTALGWRAVDLPAETLVVLASALFTGQLSIGWSNDAIDAPRDTAAGRSDKPIARGLVSRRVVAIAAGVAVLACVTTSLLLGAAAAAVHLVAVGSAWAYNARLKSTVLSPLPYAVSFALLPAVATASAEPPDWPPLVVCLAGAALGIAAHFANTVSDTAADAATGVRGLPQVMGARASMLVMAAGVTAAGLLLLVRILTADDATGAIVTRAVAAALLGAGILLAVAAGLVTATTVTGRADTERGAAPFRVTLAAVALVVAGFVTAA